MFLRILDPRFLTMAAALFLGAATIHAEPGTPVPNSPPPTKKSSVDGPKKSRTIPANLARVTHHPRNFRGWSKYCWFPRYQCYGYYNASQRMWFYYYEPFARFLPIRYLTTYPPTTVGIGPVTTTAATAPAASAAAALAAWRDCDSRLGSGSRRRPPLTNDPDVRSRAAVLDRGSYRFLIDLPLQPAKVSP